MDHWAFSLLPHDVVAALSQTTRKYYRDAVRMNRFLSLIKALLGPAIVVGVLATLWLFRDELFRPPESTDSEAVRSPAESPEKQTILEISEQARKDLGLSTKAARPQTYWRSVAIPDVVSDRGVTSPAVGIVTEMHAFPGDTMLPGEQLFTLRLFSEYLQSTQTQLFKSNQHGNA
jgi:hypothetical protein